MARLCNGNFVELLREKGHDAYGVDIGIKAEEHWKTYPTGIREKYIRHDIQIPHPLFDIKFDLINASHVIEHCHNPTQAIKNIRQLLKPDGVFHVVLPIEPKEVVPGYHFSFFSGIDDFTDILTGFEVLESQTGNARSMNEMTVIAKRIDI